MIIAIDGPAGAGKGTLAHAIARHYGYACLDTGALYRAVGLLVLRRGGDPADSATAGAAARALTPDLLDDPALKEDATAAAASQVAVLPEVRAALLDFQRDFAHNPPGGRPGAVLDGRDVGTVVCPDADIKLFVTASVEARADRRVKELRQRGVDAIREHVLEDMKARDARDAERAEAPLKPAADARVLDTTDLDVDAALRAALSLIASRAPHDGPG